ncbi:MAG: glycosyltransferase [Thainema sp.]
MSMLPRSAEGLPIKESSLLPAVQTKDVDQTRPPRIKVLFFTPSLGSGGAEMHLLRILNALDRQGFEPSVAVAQQGGSYETALAEDVTVYALNPAGMPSSTLRMMRAIKPLRQLIQAERPDIVCSLQGHANLAAIRACQGIKPQPKLIICVQNSPFSKYYRRWHPLDQLMLLLMAKLYPQADQVVALSSGVAEELRSLMGQSPVDNTRSAPHPPIDIIYNAGVDDAVLKGSSETSILMQRSAHQPVIVACGRLHPQKGYPYLLKALVKVRQSISATLWILGEGPLRPMLEQQIKTLGLTRAVKFLGFQANPYQYMAAADVFVLSSIYEGFGNVIVEAMACGVPVVATNCPHGPAEILEQGKNGLLALPGDVDSLARQLLKVLQDPELQETLARRGLMRSQAFHSSTIAANYGQVFRQVLA